MARWKLFAVAAAAILGLAVFIARDSVHPGSAEIQQTTKNEPPTRVAEPAIDTSRVRAAEALPGGVNFLPESRELVALLNDPREAPEQDLEVIENMLGMYRRIFGANPPGGLNREIIAAMLGDNPRRLAILPPDLTALSPEGDLLDRWGTPFLFHPVSGQLMEVMSAGPDKALWTADDVGRIEPAGAMPPSVP
jgi:hypothetical protein